MRYLESQGRALILKEYFDLFGHNLPQVMPYLAQWELLSKLRKDSNLDLILTSNGLSLDPIIRWNYSSDPELQPAQYSGELQHPASPD
jgi:hypothetical protein